MARKLRTVVVSRNGEKKLRVPAEERNGILRSGDSILINADLLAASGLSREHVMREVGAGRITPEIEALGMRLGDNGNGLIVRWLDDILAQQRVAAKAAYDALPADVRASREERAAISDLYARAEKALNRDTDADNVSRGYSLRAEADRRLADWRERCPRAAAEEEAVRLLSQAEHEETLAAGALTYDADGWLSRDEQQRRHDEHVAKAADLREQASRQSTD